MKIKIALAVIAILMCMCQDSFEVNFGKVKVAKKDAAVFSVKINEDFDIKRRDFILGFTNCEGNVEVVLENDGEDSFEVFYTSRESGEALSKMKNLVASGAIKFPLEINDKLGGFTLVGFPNQKSNITMTINFDKIQGPGSEVSARAVWADGP